MKLFCEEIVTNPGLSGEKLQTCVEFEHNSVQVIFYKIKKLVIATVEGNYKL
jgi:hypothetical protein